MMKSIKNTWPAIVVVVLATSVVAEQPAGMPEIVAHRGASHDAPENTLAAVELGWKQGADCVEIDVWLTGDDQIIAMHDKTTGRTAGKDWQVGRRTLAELRTLEVGAWKHSKWKGEPVPTLAEMLATIPEQGKLLIEVKCGPEIVPALKRDLEKAGKPNGQTVIISFNDEVIAEVEKQMPELTTYLVAGWKKDKKTGEFITTIDELIARAKAAKTDGLDVDARGPLDEAAVRKMRDAGLAFHVWTVDDVDLAKEMTVLGVDSITTNRPAWLRQQLAAGSKK